MIKEEEDKKECDDPCDDCTDIEMSNLTGWITPSDKPVDNSKEE